MSRLINKLSLAIMTTAIMIACGPEPSDSSRTLIQDVDPIDFSDPARLWEINSDMALLSDYIYQLRDPHAGIIPWSPDLELELEQSGYSLITAEKSHGEFALFVNTDQDLIVVVFRGTNIAKPGDLMTNADFRLTHFDKSDPRKGMVSSGYLNRWLAHRNDVIENLQAAMIAMEPRKYSIIFTGHSLGGAVATLAAMQAYSNGLNVSAFSFAVPHFADDTFVDYTRSLVDDGMFITSHEVVGDPIINTVRPARNPLVDIELDFGQKNFFAHEPLPELGNPHSIAHIRGAIRSSKHEVKKSFFNFYRSRPFKPIARCL